MRILGLVLISLVVSYIGIASLSGQWQPFHWKVESQAWALVGELTFLVLFVLYRHKHKND